MPADKLRNICFVQRLYSDRTQTTVRSMTHSRFDEVAETAVEGVSAIFSKNETYNSSNVNSEGPKCSNCNKLGHVASRCYLKDKKDMRVNQLSVRNEDQEKMSNITCCNCQARVHAAKHCRKPKKHLERQGLIMERNRSDIQSGNEFRPLESSSQSTVQSTQLDRKIMNF